MLRRSPKFVTDLRLVAISCVFIAAGQTLCCAQSSATISGDHAEVTAGQPLTLHLTFDTAASCDRRIYVPLGNVETDFSIELTGTLQTGKNTADVATGIPKDFEGKFVSNNVRYGMPSLGPCPGYSITKKFAAPSISVNVKPIPDPNSYPTSAVVELTLTQNQFLATKIAELEELSSAIDTKVEADGRDSAELRTFLAEIVETAQADLAKTEQEYRTQLLRPNEPVPAFFADFRKQYADLHTELKAPVPGTRASSMEPAHMVYVQETLKRRSPTSSPTRSGNRSGTTPMVANSVKSTLGDNASAYKTVQTTGRATFHAQFESIPTGATLYYRQAIEPDFSTWSKTTNISGADFTLATFVFKFQLDNCDDEPVRTINPYENTNPDVSVEFKKCRKR
jgi:hypothetical protein